MNENQLALFKEMCRVADAYVDGNADGDDLHSAVVDYTDSVKTQPGWAKIATRGAAHAEK